MLRLGATIVLFAAVSWAADVRWHIDYAGTPATRIYSVLAAPASINAVATDREGNVYVAGSTAAGDLPLRNAAQGVIRSGSMLRSEDEGRTWEPLPLPSVTLSRPAIHPKTPSTVLVTGIYGVFRSTDSGATWKTVIDLDDITAPLNRRTVGYLDDEIQYDPADPNRAWIGATGGVLRTTDGGVTWTLLTRGLQPGYCCTGQPLSADRLHSGRLVYVINQRAYMSENGGTYWTPLRLPPNVYSGIRIVFDPFQADRLYLQAYKQTFVSTDSGVTWTKLSPSPEALTMLYPDPFTPGFLVGVTESGKLLQSADYGASWEPVAVPVSVALFEFDLNVKDRWYAGNQETVVSTDRGRTWRSLNLNRLLQVAADPVNPSRLFAGTGSVPDAWVGKYSRTGELLFGTYLGGQGSDSATAIAVDSKTGRIAVAGSTDSRDFPVSRTTSAPSSFVSFFDGTGRLLHSASYPAIVQSLAFAPDGSLHAAWIGDAGSLPVSQGGLAVEGNSSQAYYTRLSTSTGEILFSTSLGAGRLGTGTFVRLAVDRDGAPVIVGNVHHPAYAQARSKLWPATPEGDANVIRLSPDGRLAAAASVLPVLSAVAVGEDGDIYLGGSGFFDPPVLPDAWQRQVNRNCPHDSGTLLPPGRLGAAMSDAWFARVDGALTTHKGGSLFGGSCIETLSDIAVSVDGRVTLTGRGYSDPLPTTDLLALPPAPRSARVFVAQFDGNGTNLLGATYLPAAGVSSVAGLDSGGFAVTASPAQSDPRTPPSVWNMSFDQPKALRISGARIAFESADTPLAPGSIVTLKVSGLAAADSVYLGLNPAGGAPTVLAGVRVTVNGLAAPMLGVRGEEIIAIVPHAVANPGVAEVTVRTVSGLSGTSYVNVVERRLTLYPDVRNADGSLNSPENPAVERQPLTLFLTGVPPSPDARDGALAEWGSAPSPWLDTAWAQETNERYDVTDIRPVPGFVYGLYYVTVPAPAGAGARTLFVGASTIKVYTAYR